MMRTLVLAALACGLAFPAAAQTPTSQSGPTLRIGLADDADALDPTLSRTYVGRIIFAGLCDKLFDIDDKLNIVPQLATGYEWADPQTLVIKLRQGVTFHDGEKLDSAAVKTSLERHQTMQGSTRRGEISAIDRIETPDPLTVRLLLKSPSSPLVVQFADRSGMIMSPKALAALGNDFGKAPVCAGPFKFAERVPQDRIVLDRFDGYWNKSAINFARVVYRPIVDATVRLANLQAGAIDFGERFQPSDVPEISKDRRITLVQNTGLGFQSILFNIANGTRPRTPMMTDARVRQAGEVIQSMAAEAGFDVKLRTTEFVTALAASDAGDYEMFLIGWSGRADADGNVYSFTHTGPPNLNASGYSNKEVDGWLDQARAVSGIPERRALYTKVAAQLMQDLPRMYLYTPNNIFAMSTRVRGFVPVPDGMVRLQGMSIAP